MTEKKRVSTKRCSCTDRFLAAKDCPRHGIEAIRAAIAQNNERKQRRLREAKREAVREFLETLPVERKHAAPPLCLYSVMDLLQRLAKWEPRP